MKTIFNEQMTPELKAEIQDYLANQDRDFETGFRLFQKINNNGPLMVKLVKASQRPGTISHKQLLQKMIYKLQQALTPPRLIHRAKTISENYNH